MSRHRRSLLAFRRDMLRCDAICEIHSYSKATYPGALDLSDLLRSVVVMSMSGLDLLIHSLYRQEIIYRFERKLPVCGLKLPFECVINDDVENIRRIDAEIVAANAHKSFMAPDKIAEILAHLVRQPWERIASELGVDCSSLKLSVREFGRWRNRIAHESDINPLLGGLELWPIVEDDVRNAVAFIRRLGEAITVVLEKS